MPFNNQLTDEVDARDMSVKFGNFVSKYERLNVVLIQAFNLTLLACKELDTLAPKFPKLQEVSVPPVHDKLCKIDEKYPFVMLN